jgi:hypothetical protein
LGIELHVFLYHLTSTNSIRVTNHSPVSTVNTRQGNIFPIESHRRTWQCLSPVSTANTKQGKPPPMAAIAGPLTPALHHLHTPTTWGRCPESGAWDSSGKIRGRRADELAAGRHVGGGRRRCRIKHSANCQGPPNHLRFLRSQSIFSRISEFKLFGNRNPSSSCSRMECWTPIIPPPRPYIYFCILVPLTIQFFSILRDPYSRVLDHPCFRQIIARGLEAETTPASTTAANGLLFVLPPPIPPRGDSARPARDGVLWQFNWQSCRKGF